ncbi:MAG: DEAD/DEAH box helicase [Polyangiaceae bacterium]|nr:DEAD/DEAH box helicase [Polyangiaceae bacterium]
MTEPISSHGQSPPPEPTFDVLPLGPEVRRALDTMGYRHPTPVQRAVFEPAAEGRNLIVQARTGTGKTTAFGLPIIDRIVRPSAKMVQALVLCPTRELALQVSRELEQLGQHRGVHLVAIYGGASMTKQVDALKDGAQVVVGTPGRVLDHLRQQTFDPGSVRILVLDEADEMLSMGFARELHAILELLPKNRQGLFFSATLPPDIDRLAQSHLREPELITLSSDQVGALEVSHFVYVVREGDKIGHLVHLLEVEDPESAIVFCNTRDETQRVAEALKMRGYNADWLNGDLPQCDRERVMSATREGRLRFLVATDVAARGIDISHLTHVINYDFPESAEQYVHRTGRTGRAGRTGTAISLIGPKDIGNLYLLRLTYKIRPIEKQLPSAGELKTRAEMDLVQVFVDAFAGRAPHEDDRSLARRLLTHADAERIVAGLLRDHLGARAGDVTADAAEARRARNPQPPIPETPHADARPAVAKPAGTPVTGDARSAEPPAAPRRRDRDRDERRRDRPDRRGGGSARALPRSASGIANFRWEPPKEADDDLPLLEPPDIPGYIVGPAALTEDSAAAPESAAGDSVQIFVNVGTREGVRAPDLQRILFDHGVPPDDVGAIRVRDRMSFVRIRRGSFERAVAALSGQVLGGRTVVAELARGRT